jgi:hypothetical protein
VSHLEQQVQTLGGLFLAETLVFLPGESLIKVFPNIQPHPYRKLSLEKAEGGDISIY